MQRSDYAWHDLTYEQYQAIIRSGTMSGCTSPMLNVPDYNSLIAVMQEANIDPRLPLAFTFCEGHHGSDPGLVAAVVNNLGGVKFVGAAGTTDSGIPADTGGTYAAFPDLSVYWREWVRIMNNSIIGPDFRAGNLIGVVEHYTNGIGTGHNKVEKWQQYLRDYPPTGGGSMPATTTGMPGSRVLAEALKWVGTTDRGLYDPSNGHGTPFMWCEAFIESMHEHAGVTRVRYDSALAFLNDPAIPTNPLPAPAGACVLFGRQTDPSGHVAISDGAGGMIGTTTDGIRHDAAVWSNCAGWQWYPGTVPDASVVVPAPAANELAYDHPTYGHVVVGTPFVARVRALEAAGLFWQHLGYPTGSPVTLATGRMTQRFERTVLATQAAEAPWNVVSLLIGEIPAADTPTVPAPARR